jgi:hypothetical protein
MGLVELLLLGIGEGINFGLPHGAQGLELLLDLVVGRYDLLDVL